jgi:serine/threonine protein kinase
MVASPLDLPAGAVLGGDFKIEKPLARGGMGAVYVAEQLSTKKKRALKVMLPGRAGDGDLRRRFEQEAKVAALIESEHVVDVIAAGVDAQTDIPWLAMELLKGEDLESYATRRGPLPAEEVRDIFRQMCHALAAAHDIPIVHRDLKPANVFLAQPKLAEAKPIVKVLDFGIAKLAAAQNTTGASMGTPMWMAPEQTLPRAAVTPAADVWALGLIAFRLLTGRAYWLAAADGDVSPAVLVRELVIAALPPASERARALGFDGELPPGFDAWLARCLDRDVSARFAHARDAWDALAAVLPSSGEGLRISHVPLSDSLSDALAPTQLAPVSWTPERAAPPKKSRAPAFALAGAIVIAGGVAAAFAMRPGPQAFTAGPHAAEASARARSARSAAQAPAVATMTATADASAPDAARAAPTRRASPAARASAPVDDPLADQH